MRYRPLLTLGWLWPFVVVSVGVALIAAGQRLQGDIAWTSLLFASLLGSPAVVATLTYWMPDDWHPVLQVCATALLAVVVMGRNCILRCAYSPWVRMSPALG